MKSFAIYGDNIVECERMLSLIKKALKVNDCSAGGTMMAPIFKLRAADGEYQLNCFPGFDRWEHDLVAVLKESGGILRETPDVYITRIDGNVEKPILAVEFCSALPAGNQAWQRSGRAYSTARCGIPYLFVTELGGYELDASRNKKAPRLPNPAIPFSFISYSESTDADLMIAYEMNPGADDENKDKFGAMIAGRDLPSYIAAKMRGEDSSAVLNSLTKKAYSFVQAASDSKKIRVAALNTEQWNRVHDALERDGNAKELYDAFDLPWKKKLSIQTKPSFRSFLNGVEKIATAIASGDLPFCVIRRDRISALKKLLQKAYPGFLESIDDREFDSESLAICWINGFKPHGDDARPDRGVLPLLRMLVGDDIKVLSVVYGPATKQMVGKLSRSPKQLGEENGLWEAVLSLSNYVICDSMKGDAPVFQKGWAGGASTGDRDAIVMPVNTVHIPKEGALGENDVDSVIHMLFAYVLKGKCFEAMCNPPGGDWSGISLLFGGVEYRWLTLPRVSASGSKRPDHVIQVNDDTVVTIESKDYLKNLEKDIGPRLNQYCKDLFATTPSCRMDDGGGWTDHIGSFVLPDLTYVSVGAFIEKSPDDKRSALSHAKTDVAFLISFTGDIATVRIKFAPKCNRIVKELLSNIAIPASMKLRVALEQ